MCSETGEKKWRIVFPKSKQGAATLRNVKTAPSYGYLSELSDKVVDLVQNNVSTQLLHAPPALCANYNRPNLNEAVAEKYNRFENYPA